MGFLDGVLGGLVGGEMATVVNGIIAKHGGLGGLVDEFHTKGFGNTIKSWVSTGENQAIGPQQIEQVLGPDLMNQLAAKTGMTPAELSTKLSTVLPQVVDKLTPNGVVSPS